MLAEAAALAGGTGVFCTPGVVVLVVTVHVGSRRTRAS